MSTADLIRQHEAAYTPQSYRQREQTVPSIITPFGTRTPAPRRPAMTTPTPADVSRDELTDAIRRLRELTGQPAWKIHREAAAAAPSGAFTALALSVAQYAREADQAGYLGLTAPHHEVIALAASVPAEKRRELAKRGHALPDGSYPIEDEHHLRAAAHLAATGHGDVKAARALIKRRAKDLGVDVSTLPGFDEEDADEDREDVEASIAATDALALQIDIGTRYGCLDALKLTREADHMQVTPPAPAPHSKYDDLYDVDAMGLSEGPEADEEVYRSLALAMDGGLIALGQQSEDEDDDEDEDYAGGDADEGTNQSQWHETETQFDGESYTGAEIDRLLAVAQDKGLMNDPGDRSYGLADPSTFGRFQRGPWHSGYGG